MVPRVTNRAIKFGRSHYVSQLTYSRLGLKFGGKGSYIEPVLGPPMEPFEALGSKKRFWIKLLGAFFLNKKDRLM